MAFKYTEEQLNKLDKELLVRKGQTTRLSLKPFLVHT